MRKLSQVEQTQEKSSLWVEATQQSMAADDLTGKDAPVSASQDERHMFKESAPEKRRGSAKQLVVVYLRSGRRDRFHVTAKHRFFTTCNSKRRVEMMQADSSASCLIKSGLASCFL